MSKAKTIGLWAVTVLLGAAFLGLGGSKLAATAQQTADFTHWGYPLWFMYVAGATEVTGAVLLLMPRTATLGAGVLCSVMCGAVVTHIRSDEPQRLGPQFVIMLLAVVVGYARRRQVIAPFSRFFAAGQTAPASNG